MRKSSIDLHMHSYYSDDGEFSPEELVRRCSSNDIKVMAIADHNCVRANEAGKTAALRAGITYIPAIESDCTFRDINLHVLGYGIDYESPDFAAIENQIARQGRAASGQMLCATRDLGFDVTEEDMAVLAEGSFRKDIWTGEMFAEALLNRPEYTEHPLLRPYRPGGNRSDNPYVNFYWDYYSQGRCCYVKIEYPGLEEMVETIHRNGGCAVLAHPGINLRYHSELLKPVIEAGLDGIEAFSSYHTPEQCLDFYNAAKYYQLFYTCGSDFHGKTKPSIHIGGHGCSFTDKEVLHQLDKILERL